MEDVQSVQFSESLHDLHENTPYFLLGKVCPFFLMLDDLVAEISLTGILHNDAWLVKIYHKDLVDSSMKASL